VIDITRYPKSLYTTNGTVLLMSAIGGSDLMLARRGAGGGGCGRGQLGTHHGHLLLHLQLGHGDAQDVGRDLLEAERHRVARLGRHKHAAQVVLSEFAFKKLQSDVYLEQWFPPY